MSMLAKSSCYKLGLCDNWGLNALVRNFISRKIIITYEKTLCRRNYVYRNEVIFWIHRSVHKLNLGLEQLTNCGLSQLCFDLHNPNVTPDSSSSEQFVRIISSGIVLSCFFVLLLNKTVSYSSLLSRGQQRWWLQLRKKEHFLSVCIDIFDMF